jgi:hypothetical protein
VLIASFSPGVESQLRIGRRLDESGRQDRFLKGPRSILLADVLGVKKKQSPFLRTWNQLTSPRAVWSQSSSLIQEAPNTPSARLTAKIKIMTSGPHLATPSSLAQIAPGHAQAFLDHCQQFELEGMVHIALYVLRARYNWAPIMY